MQWGLRGGEWSGGEEECAEDEVQNCSAGRCAAFSRMKDQVFLRISSLQRIPGRLPETSLGTSQRNLYPTESSGDSIPHAKN
jgi:hypothetical protein